MMFGQLKEKLQERIKGWDKKTLLKGGNEVLLKTITQSLLNYAMSGFLLSLNLCHQPEKSMCSFRWRTTLKKKKISIDKIGVKCAIKNLLGEWVLGALEISMQLSRIIKAGDFFGIQKNWLVKSTELVIIVMVLSYGSFLNVSLGHNPNYIWRSVLEFQNVI